MKVLLSWLREFVADRARHARALRAAVARRTGGRQRRDARRRDPRRGGGGDSQHRPASPAERLTLCEVRTGSAPTVSVVCGARNMKAGDRVAYAPPGARLPGERRIDAGRDPRRHRRLACCARRPSSVSAPARDGILLLGADAPLGQRLGGAPRRRGHRARHRRDAEPRRLPEHARHRARDRRAHRRSRMPRTRSAVRETRSLRRSRRSACASTTHSAVRATPRAWCAGSRVGRRRRGWQRRLAAVGLRADQQRRRRDQPGHDRARPAAARLRLRPTLDRPRDRRAPRRRARGRFARSTASTAAWHPTTC